VLKTNELQSHIQACRRADFRIGEGKIQVSLRHLLFLLKARKCSKTPGVCPKDPGANLKRRLPAKQRTMPALIRKIYLPL
jgi:hypothetical protein